MTIWLTIVVALLSVLTGVPNIGAQSVVGPLALRASTRPPGGVGLDNRPVTTDRTAGAPPVESAVGSTRRSVGAGASERLYNHSRFTTSLTLSSSQLASLLALAGVQLSGTFGAYALRDEFASVETLVDAFYYTLVTARTVGYGDAIPTTQMSRLFGMSVLLLGTASFALALGTLLGPVIEGQLA